CVRSAWLLGGVGVAVPGANTVAASSDSSPTPHASAAPEASGQDQQSNAPHAGGSSSAAPVHTAADCQAQLAAVQGQLPAVQDATGLAHAINTVEANCEKNLQAPGLVNALGHLVLNWQRPQAHEAAQAAKVHGNAGVHGNSGNHGPSSDGTVTGS